MRRTTDLRQIAIRFCIVAALVSPGLAPVRAQDAAETSRTTILSEISFVHGGSEPFAVAGYRIGERALKELKLPRGSFLLEVVHSAPEEVQWSCIADGIQVSTGASEGKLNLKVVTAAPGEVSTRILDRRTGKTLVFRLKPQFVARYLEVSHDKLDAAGAEVLALQDDQIFVMATTQ